MYWSLLAVTWLDLDFCLALVYSLVLSLHWKTLSLPSQDEFLTSDFYFSSKGFPSYFFFFFREGWFSFPLNIASFPIIIIIIIKI